MKNLLRNQGTKNSAREQYISLHRLLIVSLMVVLSAQFGQRFLPTAEPVWSLGILMILAFLGGKLVEKLKLPSVVGFVAVGVLLGPDVTHLISKDTIGQLEILKSLALGWIGFHIGASLRVSAEDLSRRIFGLASFSVILTSLLNTLVLVSIDLPVGLAVLLGLTASVFGPFLIFALERQGSFLLSLTTIGVGVSFLFWTLAAVGINLISSARFSIGENLRTPLEFFGSVGLGFLLAGILTLTCPLLNTPARMATFFFGMISLAFAAAHVLSLSLVLLVFSTGFFAVHLSADAERVLEATRPASDMMAIPLFGIFGAQIALDFLLTSPAEFWPIALVYIISIIMGKAICLPLGVKLLRIKQPLGGYLGVASLPQGIVAFELIRMTRVRFGGQPWWELFLGITTFGLILGSLIFPVVMKFIWSFKGGQSGITHEPTKNSLD